MPNVFDAFGQPFVQNALIGGTVVALLGAFVGYFVIARGASFATHALSQIGFAGAAGAVLLGIEPIVGLIVFAVLGAFGLSALGRYTRASDVVTALALVAALGTGALFLALQRDYASNVFSLLFGTIVGVDRAQVAITAAAALVAAAALAFIARPLLFATASREAALVAGVATGALDLAFLTIVGISAAVTVPIAGTLLVFSLTIGPAAAASHLATKPVTVIGIAGLLGVAAFVCALALAYETDWPVGFYIAAITTAQYVVARAFANARDREGA